MIGQELSKLGSNGLQSGLLLLTKPSLGGFDVLCERKRSRALCIQVSLLFKLLIDGDSIDDLHG